MVEAALSRDLPRHQIPRDLPFLGLEPGWWVPRDEEEGSHGMHVTQSWDTEETISPLVTPRAYRSPSHQDPPKPTSSLQPLFGPSLLSQTPHLRGAPSAISMAVIPRDQMSLYRGGKKGQVNAPGGSPHLQSLVSSEPLAGQSLPEAPPLTLHVLQLTQHCHPYLPATKRSQSS